MEEVRLWKEEYRIGDGEIDAQHRELFRRVEALLAVAMTGDETANQRECLELLDFLVSYTVRHFEAEEALQKRQGYVSYDLHARIHRDFKNTVLAYQEKVKKDFSKETLKKLLGTLMTWLTVHVCGCDRKIVRNLPIAPEISFDGADDLIRRVTVQLLTDTYGIQINCTRTSVYKGYVEGKIFVRIIIGGEKNYVFLFGFSDEMAQTLYRKVSGMGIRNTSWPNAIEKSALIELGDILASQAVSYINQKRYTGLQWKGDLFLKEYSDPCIDISKSILLDFETDCGRLEILHCLAGKA